ncbi:T9SS type A sorting domain-containing protein [Polaribacter aestuariivivens]|nr:T9SS type A sorting domain-containing protein [Polaribacter aestuariivivens]
MKKLLFTFFVLTIALQTFNAQTIVGWEFTSDDEGWNKNPARCTTAWNSAGYLDVTTQGVADPFFFNTTDVTLATTNVNFLELSIKNETANGGGSILLLRTNDTNVNIPYSMTPNSTAFETIVIDLSKVTNFSNNLQIDNVRIDPNNGGAAGTISFDYIRFVETPTNPVLATSVAVDGPSSITVNEIATYTATISPNNTTFNDVEYSVDDTNIARINPTGVLVPKKTGTVTVTATATDGSNVSGSKQVTITEGSNTILNWEFDADDEGWNRAQTRCSTAWNSQGYLDATTTGDNDPFFYRNPKIEFNAKNFKFIELSVKNGTADTEGGILLFTGAGNVNVPVPMTANNSGFETIVIDLATTNLSNETIITDVRLDPNLTGATGVVSYDYIRFLENPSSTILATSITIDGPSTITTNEIAQFTTTISPENATFKSVDYSVNDTNVATIDSSGLLVPKTAGTVTVTATSTDGSNVSDSKQITITQGPNTIISWEFDTDDEGWNKNPLRCTTAWNSAGYLDVTTIGENDPNVRNTTAQPFSAAGANFLIIKVKNETASDSGQLIFFRGGGASPKTALFTMTPNSTDFETIVVDLPASVSNWSVSDNFIDVRLDANTDGSAGVVSFDFIRITKEDNTASVASQKMLDATFTYPNPVTQGQNLNVNLERFSNTDKIKLFVNDITGKLIYSKEVLGGKSESISTNQLNTGIYLVSVKNNRSFKTFKVIVN